MMWLFRPSPSINSTMWSICCCVEPCFMTTIILHAPSGRSGSRLVKGSTVATDQGQRTKNEKKGSLGEIDAEAPYKLRLHPTAARRPLWEQPPLVTTTH